MHPRRNDQRCVAQYGLVQLGIGNTCHPDGDVAQSPSQRFAHDVIPLVRDVVARQQQDRGFETPGQDTNI